MSVLIGKYLHLGISPHTLIPEIKKHVGESELFVSSTRGDLDPVLYGMNVNEIVLNEADKAYYLPVYRESNSVTPAFFYKFYIDGDGKDADMSIPVGSGKAVYIDLCRAVGEKRGKVPVKVPVAQSDDKVTMVMTDKDRYKPFLSQWNREEEILNIDVAENVDKRHVFIGDIHGDLTGLLFDLMDAGLIDKEWNWIGGDAVLVQMGDTIDRGYGGVKTYEFLGKLQEDARKSGGDVIRLLGNHELMMVMAFSGPLNSLGQWIHNGGDSVLREIMGERYSGLEKGMAEVIKGMTSGIWDDSLEPKLQPIADIIKKDKQVTDFVERVRADVLQDKVVAAYQSGGKIVVHGGDASGKKISKMVGAYNEQLKRAVAKNDFSGPLFDVGNTRLRREKGAPPSKMLTPGGIFWADYELELLGLEEKLSPQIVGHTPERKKGSKVRVSPGGRIANVDVGHASIYGGNRGYLTMEGVTPRRVSFTQASGLPEIFWRAYSDTKDMNIALDDVMGELYSRGYDHFAVSYVWNCLRQVFKTGMSEDDFKVMAQYADRDITKYLNVESVFKTVYDLSAGNRAVNADDIFKRHKLSRAAVFSILEGLAARNRLSFNGSEVTVSDEQVTVTAAAKTYEIYKNDNMPDADEKTILKRVEDSLKFGDRGTPREYYDKFVKYPYEMGAIEMKTYFGRDSYGLEYSVMRAALSAKLNDPAQEMNILIVGMATGEQAYDVAGFLAEKLDALGFKGKINIVGTDIIPAYRDAAGKRAYSRVNASGGNVEDGEGGNLIDTKFRIAGITGGGDGTGVKLLSPREFKKKYNIRFSWELLDVLDGKAVARLSSRMKFDLVVGSNVHYEKREGDKGPQEKAYFGNIKKLLKQDGLFHYAYAKWRTVTRPGYFPGTQEEGDFMNRVSSREGMAQREKAPELFNPERQNYGYEVEAWRIVQRWNLSGDKEAAAAEFFKMAGMAVEGQELYPHYVEYLEALIYLLYGEGADPGLRESMFRSVADSGQRGYDLLLTLATSIVYRVSDGKMDIILDNLEAMMIKYPFKSGVLAENAFIPTAEMLEKLMDSPCTDGVARAVRFMGIVRSAFKSGLAATCVGDELEARTTGMFAAFLTGTLRHVVTKLSWGAHTEKDLRRLSRFIALIEKEGFLAGQGALAKPGGDTGVDPLLAVVQRELDDRYASGRGEQFILARDIYLEEEGKINRTLPDLKEEKKKAEIFEDTVKLAEADGNKRPVIIALGTSWIKGYEKGRYPQYEALNPLILSIRRLCKEHGVIFVEDDDEGLFDSVKAAREKAPRAKVVVLAGLWTVAREEFVALREAGDAFLVGVDNSKLTNDSYVRLVEMIDLAVKLSAGEEPAGIPAYLGVTKILQSRDKILFYIFTPRAEPMDYEELRQVYRVQTFA
jgi:hypothetical protein